MNILENMNDSQSNECLSVDVKTEGQQQQQEQLTTSSSNTQASKKEMLLSASKSYRIKYTCWFCEVCDIYCNSQSQFDVHMISQKHKLILEDEKERLMAASVVVKSEPNCNDDSSPLVEEDGSSSDKSQNENVHKAEPSNLRSRANFSMEEIAQNPIAIKFNINAVKYLITEDKKHGKFEKFGFYCKTCDAYMTGQIQLIMHVRGAKHQYFFPNEIPDYKPSKQYNPFQRRRSTVGSNSPDNDKHSIRQPLNPMKQHHHPMMDNNNCNSNTQLHTYHQNPTNNKLIDHIARYQSQLYATKQTPEAAMYPTFIQNHYNSNSFDQDQQQMAYNNFKIHPLYTYQMMLNQRLKQNQSSCDLELSAKSFNGMGQQQQQQQQMAYNNHYEQQYIQHQYNQANMLNPLLYSNVSTPTQQQQQQFNGHSKLANTNQYMGAVQSLLRFDSHGNQQSPIPYMLPQSSTPASSFNQTPMHVQPRCKKNLLRDDSKMFGGFNTPPSGNNSFSYNRQQASGIQQQHQI